MLIDKKLADKYTGQKKLLFFLNNNKKLLKSS